MGGFTLVRANEEEVLLDDDSFCKVLRMWPDSKPRFGEASEIVFPTMTAAEIHDKGRGDFLSKAIVVLQTTWFIMQCVARGIEGIALTELELVTLALASLNGLMYYFWWDKPLGVKEPIKVYTIDTDPPRKVVDGAERRVSVINQISFEILTIKCRNATNHPWRLHDAASFRDFLLPFITCRL